MVARFEDAIREWNRELTAGSGSDREGGRRDPGVDGVGHDAQSEADAKRRRRYGVISAFIPISGVPKARRESSARAGADRPRTTDQLPPTFRLRKVEVCLG